MWYWFRPPGTISLTIHMQMRCSDNFAVRVSVSPSKVKPNQRNILSHTVPQGNFAKISAPTIQVKPKLFTLVSRKKLNVFPLSGIRKGKRFIVHTVFLHRQKRICLPLSQIDICHQNDLSSDPFELISLRSIDKLTCQEW